MNNDKHAIGKGLATIGICVLGGFYMYVSGDSTGIQWAILGIFIIWVWG